MFAVDFHPVLVGVDNGEIPYTQSGAVEIQQQYEGMEEHSPLPLSIELAPTNGEPVVADNLPVYGPVYPGTIYTAGSGAVLGNSFSPNGSVITVSAYDSLSASGAAVVVNPDGSFSYDPRAIGSFRSLGHGASVNDTFKYTLSDSQGRTAVGTATLQIVGQNDPPSVVTNLGFTVVEGASVPITNDRLSASDPDDTAAELTFFVQTAPLNGRLERTDQPNVAITSFTQAQVDAGIIVYRHNGSETTMDQITLRLSDGGEDGAVSITFAVSITVTPVNNPPLNINSFPSVLSVNEDTPSPIDLSTIVLSDTDIETGDLTLKLNADHGTITPGTMTGITITGSGTAHVQITGKLAALNTYLSNPTRILFLTDPNLAGVAVATLTISVTDGQIETQLGSVQINSNGVNDDPSVSGSWPTIPPLSVGQLLRFNLPALTMQDPDIGTGHMTLKLKTNSSKLFAVSTPTVTVQGAGTKEISIIGSLANVNSFVANADVFGIKVDLGQLLDTISVYMNDNGNSGAGGGTDILVGSMPVTVAGTILDPSNQGALPTSLSVNEDTLSPIDLSSIQIVDLDAGSVPLTLTLSVTSGTLNAQSAPGLTIAGNNTAVVAVTGTLASLNSLLSNPANIKYLGANNVSGNSAATLAIKVNDNNVLPGSELGDIALGTIPIHIQGGNDDPVNVGTLPVRVIVEQGATTPLDLSLIDLDDSDIGNGQMSFDIQTTGGTFTASNAGGVFVQGSGTNHLQLIGRLSDINTFLDNPTAINFNVPSNVFGIGALTLTLKASDNGNTGSGGGALVPLGTIPVDVVPINILPTALGVLPSLLTVVEDTASNLGLLPIAIVDPDVLLGNMTLELRATNGTLTASAFPGITLTGNGTGVLQATGALAAVNLFLAQVTGVKFQGDANLFGSKAASVSVFINDHSGNGGGTNVPLGTIQLDISGVNDDPTLIGTLPTSATLLEDTLTSINLTGLKIADVDAQNGQLSVILSAPGFTIQAVPQGSISITGNSTSTTTIRGTLADLTTYFTTPGVVSLKGGLNVNGTNVGTLAIKVNDHGNTGSGGGTDILLGQIPINITPVNDPPYNNGVIPPTLVFIEDTLGSVDFSNVEIADIDSTSVAVVIRASAGTLSASSSGGVTVTGSGTQSISLSGTITAVNTYLHNISNIQYLGALDVNGLAIAQLTFEVDDGGPSVLFGTVPVDITAVNDLPINAGTLPSFLTIVEDILSPVDLSPIDLQDVDAGTSPVTIKVQAVNSTLTATSSGGVTVTGSGTSNLSLVGTLSALNTYINDSTHIKAQGLLNLAGVNVDTITVKANDGIGADVSFGQIQLNITAMNDDPYNSGTIPADLSIVEDILSSINLSAINLVDPDAGSNNLTLILQLAGGTLTATGAAGISITGNGTGVLRLSGTLSALNTYLDNITNLKVLGQLNLNGDNAGLLSISVTDNGSTGLGGGGTISLGSANLDISAINDDPINIGSLLTTPTIVEDILTGINLSSIVISDVDVGSGNMTMTIQATNGTLTGQSLAGITLGGNGTSQLSVSGTLTALNSYLQNTSYIRLLGSANLNGLGAATVAVYVSDNGNTGTGGGAPVLLAQTTVDISAVNDDPTNLGTLPVSLPIVEDIVSALNLSTIQIGDVDGGSGTFTLTLQATNSVLSAVPSTGITITGNNTGLLKISGTMSVLNAYLGVATNISALGALNLNGNGAATVTVSVNDNGNTGSGGGGNVQLGVVNLNISAVNDAPTNIGVLPSTLSLVEDVLSSLNLSGIVLQDVDVGSGNLTVTLQSANSTLSAISSGGVTVGGSGTSTLTLTGNLTSLNAYLAVLTNVKALGTLNLFGNGVGTIDVSVNDNGNTGSGGANSVNLGQIGLNISGVNDDPTLVGTIPSTFTILEDVLGNLNLSGMQIADVDASTGNMSLRLQATTGTLSALNSGGVTATGNGTNTVTLTGTLANLNAYLAVTTNISALSQLNLNGNNASTLSISVNDNGNTGTGGGSWISLGSSGINITAVNDDPYNAGTLPATLSLTHAILTGFSTPAINLADVDLGSGNLTVTLQLSAGVLFAGALTGIAITGSGTSTVTLTGTIANLNNYLKLTTTLSMLTPGALLGNGAATLSVSVKDNGNTGLGGGTNVLLGSISLNLL